MKSVALDMSTSPVLRLPSSDPDQAWKDEAKHAHFINDLEANVAQLQSCQALLHNKEDATAFIEIFKKDIAILRLVSTERDIAKEVPLWGKCDEIERKLNAIATQVSRIAAGLPSTEERKALPAPAPASSDQPPSPQKPATGGQSAPESPRGGLWGGFEQLVSQIGRYAPMLLGGIGAIAAAIGAFRQWGGQNQEAASAGDDQQAPQSEPQQPSSVAAPVAQPSGEENPSAKEAPEASAEDTKPQERPPESAPPEPTDDAQRPGAAADPRGSQEKESISKEDSIAPRPEDDSLTAESQRQEEPAAPTVQPTREEEASSTKDTSQAPAETPRP